MPPSTSSLMAVQRSSLKQSKREITSNYKSCERKRAGGRENIGKREKGRRGGREREEEEMEEGRVREDTA